LKIVIFYIPHQYWCPK